MWVLPSRTCSIINTIAIESLKGQRDERRENERHLKFGRQMVGNQFLAQGQIPVDKIILLNHFYNVFLIYIPFLSLFLWTICFIEVILSILKMFVEWGGLKPLNKSAWGVFKYPIIRDFPSYVFLPSYLPFRWGISLLVCHSRLKYISLEFKFSSVVFSKKETKKEINVSMTSYLKRNVKRKPFLWRIA